MAAGFQLLFDNLNNVGFFEFFLPILLFVAIYFGLLRKTEVLGDDESVVGAAAIALSFATTFGLYMVVPFEFFKQAFGLIAVVLIALLSVVMVLAMSGINIEEEDRLWLKLGAAATGIFLIILALPALVGETFNVGVAGFGFGSEEVQSFILTLVLIGGMLGVIYKLAENGE